jgi:anionic cell wall polymer biosynthesis LytR-Cps2A-Psr (LCP) family protein
VKAIFRKAMNLNVVFKLPELYGAYREYVDTNLQLGDILPYMSLASEVMKTQNINQYAVGPETVTNWITAEGAMVLIPNYYAINPIIAEALYLND